MAEEPQNYSPNPPPYAPQVAPAYQQTAYVPQPAKPIRKGRGGSALMVWLLGGCGVIAIIFIVSVAYFTMNVGKTISDFTAGLPSAEQNLLEIRDALDTYTQEHDGRYPPTLDKIVDPKLLAYTSAKGTKVYVEYTPPDVHSASDAGVAGFYLGDMMKMRGVVDQRLYIRLLKNGTLVQEQITRSPIQGQ